MTRHKHEPPQEISSAAASYLILVAVIGVILLPALMSLWLGAVPTIGTPP